MIIGQEFVVRRLTPANHSILFGDCILLHNAETGNDFELKNEALERKLHRMAKVHDFLEMWQGSQSLHVIQPESQSQNM